ncbi:MAG: aminotransferase class III-fold pyridoxal phosphate-dependent enzyme, partial [Pseudomonadales bacterium]|nr:aminotransferase class III-fold pyridoxal phosphate-dependent enzyme [Pseudomonadales bacterium]
NASLSLLSTQTWQMAVENISRQLHCGLQVLRQQSGVADVRVLGAIGVVELNEPVVMKKIQPLFVEKGVWIRPFGKLVYVMPPFVISDEELQCLIQGMVDVVTEYLKN